MRPTRRSSGSWKAAGDLAGKAEATNNIASVHLALMDWQEALSQATEARAFYREAGDGAGEAVVLNNIAAAHDGMGDWQQAVATYEEALTLRQSLGDQEGEAKTLRNLAILFAQHGDRNRAKATLSRALGVAQRAKSRAVLAEIRKTMSQLPRLAEALGSLIGPHPRHLHDAIGGDGKGVAVLAHVGAIVLRHFRPHAGQRSTAAMAFAGSGVQKPGNLWPRRGRIRLATGAPGPSPVRALQLRLDRLC